MRFPFDRARTEPLRAIVHEGGAVPIAVGVRPKLDRAKAVRREAAFAFLTGFVLLLAAGAGLTVLAELDWVFLPVAVLVYGVIAAFAFSGLAAHPHASFGAPNVVTTLRAAATALFAGLVLDAGQIDGGPRELWAWTFAAIAFIALVMDGLDGYLARRLKLSSAFGARFDMEVDALLILLLSVLAYGLGKAGAFVLAIGLMRYAYVLAQQVLPWLRRDLPPSFRRKAVCVMQAAVLGVIITPLVQPPVSDIAALVTVAFLAWSFASDIAFAHRHRHEPA